MFILINRRKLHRGIRCINMCSHVESINLENVLRQSDNGFTVWFEPDMIAFSGFYYGGGDKERRELAAIRRRWKTSFCVMKVTFL
ncbi:hypothetical protein YC2023_075960 [Brassica napus]